MSTTTRSLKHHAAVICGLTLALPIITAAAGPTFPTEDVVDERVGSEYETFRVVRVVDALEHPWAVAFLADDRVLITERPGRLVLIDDGERIEVDGLPDDIHVHNQGGLLDIAVHPEHERNGWVYLTYAKGDADGTATTLIRGRLENGRLDDVEQIFTQDRRSSPGRHYGSRLAFTDDGMLLMSIGDRGVEPERAQDLEDHAGSLLRLRDDGSVPDDNPFVDRDDAHHEIYSYGHRNIQGLVVHPETNEIWVHDHGPRGGDRLDLIRAGENYGWPVVSYGRDYRTEEQWGEGRTKPGMVEPIREFLPTLAPSGFTVVTGEQFENWNGNFLIGGLMSEQVRRVRLENHIVVHEEELIRGLIGRVRDVRMGPDDLIYVLTDEENGGLYRLEPVS